MEKTLFQEPFPDFYMSDNIGLLTENSLRLPLYTKKRYRSIIGIHDFTVPFPFFLFY